MTFPDLALFIDKDDTTMDFETNKDKIREAVKEAVALYNNGHITEEMLKAIAEAALAFEITEGLENKMSKKAKRFGL